MALQKEIQTHGLTISKAYLKVSEINWSDQSYWKGAQQPMELADGSEAKAGEWVSVRVTAYADKEAKDNSEEPMYNKLIMMPIAYSENWVKSFRQYVGCLSFRVDVLDIDLLQLPDP